MIRPVLTIAVVLVAGNVGCSSPGSTDDSPPPSSRVASPSSVAPSAASGDIDWADQAWYELIRASDTHGNTMQSLLVGWLDGRVSDQFVVAEGTTPLGLATEIQVEGVFADSVLVWAPGRPGVISAIHANGSSTEVLEVDESIHAATADAALSRIFYVTLGAGSEPFGLWVTHLDGVPPIRLPYEFPDRTVSGGFRYRVVVSADGSALAIQADEGPITILDVESGMTGEVAPGGRMLGFGDGHLLAFGEGSDVDRGPVIAFDTETLEGEILIDRATSAQVVPGTAGDLLAVQQNDPDNVRAFEILAVSIRTGETWLAHTHDPADIGASLHNRDRNPVGAELPPDWVLLVDSFSRFAIGPDRPPIDEPESAYPKLLNLRTGETIRVGPFRDAG